MVLYLLVKGVRPQSQLTCPGGRATGGPDFRRAALLIAELSAARFRSQRKGRIRSWNTKS
jgi:hypothetical protein